MARLRQFSPLREGAAESILDRVQDRLAAFLNPLARQVDELVSDVSVLESDAQAAATLSRETTDATAARLTRDALSLPNNGALAVWALVSARAVVTGDTKAWQVSGALKRGAGAATTALVGTPAVTVVGEDAGATTWDVDLVADTATGSAALEVTGAAGTSIRWEAKVITT